MTETLTTALERSAQSGDEKNIRDLMEANAVELAKKLPRGLEFEYFKQAVYSELRRTPKLYECDPVTGLAAVVYALQLGLSPGPLGHFYLVPFDKKVVPIIGYKGMIHLGYGSGLLKRIETGLVCEGDDFTFRKGSRPFLDHTPSGPMGEREWTHVYAVAELKGGGKPEFEVLFPEDVEKRRKRSAAADKPASPWNTDTAAMWRKSAVRALQPYLPQSPLLARYGDRDEAPIEALEELEDG